MSSLIIYIIIVLVLAAVIVALSVHAYNRRLDRITRGEERHTHSAVPEPRTTVSVLYRTILMGVVIVSLLTVSALSGKISSLQSSLNELRSNQNSMNWDLESIRQQLEERDERVELFAWEMMDADVDSRTAEVRFFVRLQGIVQCRLRRSETRRNAGTLTDVKHTVVPQKRDLFDLTGFFINVFKELPEHNNRGFLAGLHAASLFDALLVHRFFMEII